MADTGPIRLSKAAKELNVGLSTVVEFLDSKGIKIEARPNTKLDATAYQLLVEEYAPDRAKKQKSEALSQSKVVRETITLDDQTKGRQKDQSDQEEVLIKNVGGIAEPEAEEEKEPEKKEKGPTVVGKIDLDTIKSNRPTKKNGREERRGAVRET